MSLSSEPRNFAAIAISYAQDAIADRRGEKFGRLIRLAANRFMDDLARAAEPDAPFYFDPKEAARACGFIECLPHVEGKWETPNIVLHPAHIFFIVQLFGFRNPDGTRRFTSALLVTARKNAKSTIAAAIMLYCQSCEDEPGAQLISAATTGDQARKVWNPAKLMVDRCADLREAFGLQAWANSISRVETGASFKPINSKASTQDGLNPSHCAMDEIHAHQSPDLLNVLTSAAGARRNPLFLYTTTEGYLNPGPWGELRLFAQQVLQGIHKDADHFLAVFFAVDEADDDFDEAIWIKANPLLDVNPNLLAAIRKEAVEARAMPSKLAEFRIKRLNRQSSSASGWIDLQKWQACDGEVDLDWLEGKPCTAAFDLAATTDLTAWRLVWDVDGTLYTFGRRWVPEDAVKQRTIRGTVSYAGWVAGEYMTQTSGNVTDYTVVEKTIREDVKRFKPSAIAFDTWNAQELANRLTEDGLPLIAFVQGTKSFHPAMQELEKRYLAGKFRHGGDPVLQWCASNLVARRDVNLSMAPDRKKSADKIDDMCALLMAIGVGLVEKPKAPEYRIVVI